MAMNMPVKYWSVDHWAGEERFGIAALTDITSTDTVSNFPTVYTANNTALETAINTLEGTTTMTLLTSAPSLATVGTITSGTWSGTTIATTKGGTGLTSYTTGDIIYSSSGNTLSKLGIGSAGQVLQVSGGVPAWANATVNEGLAYNWTGAHTWSAAASSTLFAVLDTLYVGRTATSTIQGNTTGTSALQGYLNILGSGTGTSTISANLAVSNNATTTNLTISSRCVGCLSGYERVTNTGSGPTSPGTTGSVSVSCTSGKKVVGGGGSISTYDSGELYSAASYPSSETAWSADFQCFTGGGGCSASTMTVYAICAYP